MNRLIRICALALAVTMTSALGQDAEIEQLRAAAAAGDAQAQVDLATRLLPLADTAEKLLEAVNLVKQSAAADNPRGVNLLGGLYLYGRGVSQDTEEAQRLLETAAELGDSDALVTLGGIYLQGIGVAVDYQKAYSYYLLAAEQGQARGQDLLGQMYFRGTGVAADAGEAVKWFRLAAAQNDPSAIYNLALLTIDGNGVEANVEKGIALLKKSAALGTPAASYFLGVIYESGEKVEEDLPVARQWYVEAVAVPQAAYRLALMEKDGIGGAVDLEAAFEHFVAAAQQGLTEAMVEVSEAYKLGQGVDKDATLSRQWLSEAAGRGNLVAKLRLSSDVAAENRRNRVPPDRVARIVAAADNGSAAAQLKLGTLYLYGEGVDRDRSLAVRWLAAAADAGVVEAMRRLGNLYLKKDATEQERTAGIARLRHAAEMGDGQAQYLLGFALMTGNGAEKNDKDAVRWLLHAAEQGQNFGQVGYAYALYTGRGLRASIKKAGRWMLLADPMGGADKLDDIAADFKAGRGVPRDAVFAHFLFGLVVELDDSKISRRRYEELNEDLSERELNTSRRLTQAYERAAKKPDSLLAWRQSLNSARQLLSDRQIAQAGREAERAMKLVRSAFGAKHYNLAKVMLLQGKIADRAKEHERAEDYVSLALELLETQPLVPGDLLFSALQDAGWHYRRVKDIAAASNYFSRAYDIAAQRYGEDAGEAAGVLRLWGRSLYFADQPQLASQKLERAVAIYELDLDDRSEPEKVATLEQLADAAAKTGEASRAESMYLRVIDFHKSRRAPDSVMILSPLQSLDLLYWKQKRWSEAAYALEEYLTVLQANGLASQRQLAEERTRLREFYANAQEGG